MIGRVSLASFAIASSSGIRVYMRLMTSTQSGSRGFAAAPS